MNKYFIFLTFLLIGFDGFSQAQFEAYLSPGLGYRTISLRPGVDMGYKDSLNDVDKLRQNWSGGFSYIHDFDRNLRLQIGLMYRRISFTRVKSDLQFHDTIHPAIGRIEDLSQTVQKDAYFYHKYRYLSVPIVFQQFVAPKYGRSKSSIYVVAGLSFDLKIEDKIDIFLKGYSAKGKSRHTIPNDYSANIFNVYGICGARFSFEIAPKTYFNLQPHLAYPLFQTATGAEVKMRLYQVNLQAGVSRQL